jgi:hypothetical protein
MEPLVVDAREADIETLLGAPESGRRVVVRTAFLGSSHEVRLRYDGTWCCDAPMRLHKQDAREAMHRCLREQGYDRESG